MNAMLTHTKLRRQRVRKGFKRELREVVSMFAAAFREAGR